MEFHCWLVECPIFSSRLKELDGAAAPERKIAGIKFLSQQRLDFIKTNALATKIGAVMSNLPAEHVAQCGPAVKIALVSSHTVSHLAGGITVGALRRGFTADLYFGEYGLYRNELLQPDPALKAFAPNVIVIATDVHDTNLDLSPDSAHRDVRTAIDAKISELVRLWRQARMNFGATIVQQTLLNTHYNIFGSYEGLLLGAPYSAIELFNARLREAAAEERVLVLDIALHAAMKGYEQIIDPVRWYQAKQLVSPSLSPWYGDLLARVIAAAYGLSKKAVVLDLDNTLWGGVVGDDGIEGIVLGQGNAAGEAYLDFQRYLQRLSRRGIILAVCSKNDPAVAENVFKSHPDMLLRREDVASFIANWEDKATNIRRIASELNIGLDSLVFVDDNPAERDIIRRELPMVSVPELPGDVAYYAAYLSAAGYFEAASFSKEDVERADLYRTNSLRQQELNQATDIEGFLKSLQMRLEVGLVSRMNIGRVTQLTNKTNQFNLRAVKYTEPEVDRLMRDQRALALQFRLKDKFGDNGIVAVIFARPDERWPADTLFIDTWLMSCRVLSRGVEAASLQALSRFAFELGAKRLIGQYCPTARNKMVSDHYAKLRFRPVVDGIGADSSSTFWSMTLPPENPLKHHIEVDIANDQRRDLRPTNERIPRSVSR
jgi:FkbH-like protein